MKIEIHLTAEESDVNVPEPAAVRMLQDGLAMIARTPVDELTTMWRDALKTREDRQLILFKDRHAHRPRRKRKPKEMTA